MKKRKISEKWFSGPGAPIPSLVASYYLYDMDFNIYTTESIRCDGRSNRALPTGGVVTVHSCLKF